MPPVEAKPLDVDPSMRARRRAIERTPTLSPAPEEVDAAKRGFSPSPGSRPTPADWLPRVRSSSTVTPIFEGVSELEAPKKSRAARWIPAGVIENARSWATQQVVTATGITPEQINELKTQQLSQGAGSLFAERARVLMDEGIVSSGATLKDVVARSQTRADFYGKRIGDLVAELDNYVTAHPEARSRRPDPKRIAERIRTELISKLVAPADSALIERLETDATAIAAKRQITFADAQLLKKSYDRYVDYTYEQGPLEEELKKVRRIINQETETSAESMLLDIDPNMHGEFRDAKLRYSHLLRTLNIAKAALIANDTQKNSDRSSKLAQYAAAGIAAGLGWLLGVILGLDFHSTAAVSGAAGTASVTVKALSSGLGSLTPAAAAPWVYRAVNSVAPETQR
jgi:hypothetical protein